MANELETLITFDIATGQFKSAVRDIERQAEKSGKKIENSLVNPLKNINIPTAKIAIAAAAVAGAVGLAARSVISAARVQEDAVNDLNTSLRLAGSFSQEASQSFQDLASSLQQNSIFGDEVILQQAALARNFVQTNEEAKKLTRAAVELSAATGLTLESSIKNLGKTFGGLTGELGESLPQLRGLSAESLKSGAALDFVLSRFGGAAQAQLNTFSGALTAAQNAFGDLLEQIGFLITKNPIVISLIKESKSVFEGLSQSIKNIELNSFVNSLINIGQGIIQFVVAPSELLVNIFNLVKTAATSAISETVAQFGFLGQKVGELIQKFAPGSEVAQSLVTFGQSSAEVAMQTKAAFGEAVDGIFSFEQSDALSQRLETFRDTLGEFNQNVRDQADKTAKTVVKTSKDISGALNSAFSSGTSSAIQSFTKSLILGQGGFEAFGKSILGIAGDMAIQLGQVLIGTGIGIESLKALSGAAAIAAGAGLVALGTILKSFSGGEGVAAGTGGGGFAQETAGAGVEETGQLEVANEEVEPRTLVNLVVQGDILDSQDTPRRLAELLNAGFDNEGVVLKGAV